MSWHDCHTSPSGSEPKAPSSCTSPMALFKSTSSRLEDSCTSLINILSDFTKHLSSAVELKLFFPFPCLLWRNTEPVFINPSSPGPHQADPVSTDGCSDLHWREARLPHIQVVSAGRVWLHEGADQSHSLCQTDGRETAGQHTYHCTVDTLVFNQLLLTVCQSVRDLTIEVSLPLCT